MCEIIAGKRKKDSEAQKAIDLIGVLFNYEQEFRENKLEADKIKEKRNSKEYKEAINNLNEYIYNIKTKPGSLLDKAKKYFLNNQKELYTYLEDGHVDMHNNICERAVRPLTIVRRNSLFYKSISGAEITAAALSIIYTAKANALYVEKYLIYVMENIEKPIEELYPWSESLPNDLKIKLE